MNFNEGFHIGQDIGPNYLGGQLHAEARTAIHFAHRVGAVLIAALLTINVVIAMRASSRLRQCRRDAASAGTLLILMMLVIQIALGLSNIIWNLPLNVAVAHNLGGALLLLSVVAYNYYLFGGAVAAPDQDQGGGS